ncbi:MAG: hypothetical protein AAGA90_01895 [Actinomycetota bacterium]
MEVARRRGERRIRTAAEQEAVLLVGHRLDPAKLAAAWEFESSELFSDAERAALRLAFHAGVTPSAVTSDDFDALERHYSTEEIVSIVAVISLFGWLNRWNDTMATRLEDEPAAFAGATLAHAGWELGKHA